MTPRVQTATIEGWLPSATVNARRHWAAVAKANRTEHATVWGTLKFAQWEPVKGLARLTIVFVFGTQRRRDTDNLYARAKSTVDAVRKGGWIEDDHTGILELRVQAEVVKGCKATRLTLEAISSDERV